jgi:prephenate dehydrogenase
MKIGFIGAGNIGSALAGHLRKLGHSVLIANSRGPKILSQVVQTTGAVAVAVRETAKGVDLMVIAIPMKSVPSLPKDLLSELPASSPREAGSHCCVWVSRLCGFNVSPLVPQVQNTSSFQN